MLIRKLLLKLFGFHAYLRIISFVFIETYLKEWYLGEHRQVRFLSRLLRSGYTCVDIGANLGYFSLPMSKIVGEGGKVYSVEPVQAFREVLEANLRRFSASNVEVMPYALGENDGEEVAMATPIVDGVVRHGRTEIVDSDKGGGNIHAKHTAVMRRPQSLFSQLDRLDFIKCDVEGYETKIMPQLLPLVRSFRPLMEIEIDPVEHKREIIAVLSEEGYSPFFLDGWKLSAFSLQNAAHLKEIELYFLTEAHRRSLKGYIG